MKALTEEEIKAIRLLNNLELGILHEMAINEYVAIVNFSIYDISEINNRLNLAGALKFSAAYSNGTAVKERLKAISQECRQEYNHRRFKGLLKNK